MNSFNFPCFLVSMFGSRDLLRITWILLWVKAFVCTVHVIVIGLKSYNLKKICRITKYLDLFQISVSSNTFPIRISYWKIHYKVFVNPKTKTNPNLLITWSTHSCERWSHMNWLDSIRITNLSKITINNDHWWAELMIVISIKPYLEHYLVNTSLSSLLYNHFSIANLL